MLINKRFLLVITVIGISHGLQAQDVSKDIALGKQGYYEVISTMGLYHDAKIEAFLQKLGKRLTMQLNPPLFTYEFFLVDSEEPNAFALPGGKIFITHGLLALPLTEDELAGVIGHEIIHSQNRHTIKQQRNGILGALVAIPGLIIGGIFQGPAGQAIATPFVAGGLLINAQYSQKHETEADKLGVALAADAGYDPKSLSAFLARLNKQVELISGESETKSSFSSHPYTPKRQKNIENASASLSPRNVEKIVPQDSLLFLFNGLLLSSNPEYGFVANDVLYQPAHGFQIDVPHGWDNVTIPEGIGLMNEEKKAMISIMFDKDSLDANAYISALEKQMMRQSGVKPKRKEAFNWHNHIGAMLEYETTKNGKVVLLQMYVADYNEGKLVKLGSLFYEESKRDIDSVLRTAKPVKPADIPKAEIRVLRTSTANDGETLAEFIERNGAAEYLSACEILNDKTADSVCKRGQPIKWIEKVEKTF